MSTVAASVELRRFAHWLPQRDVQPLKIERSEQIVDGCTQVRRWGGFCVQCRCENVAGLLLHGAAVLCGANAQAPLQCFIQIPNRDARHMPSRTSPANRTLLYAEYAMIALQSQLVAMCSASENPSLRSTFLIHLLGGEVAEG